MKVESATLTLDDVTINGTTITEETSGSIVQIDGSDKLKALEGGATIHSAPTVQGAISNAGTVEVAGAATLLDVTLTNTTSGSVVQVDGGVNTLTLNGAEIIGGSITAFTADPRGGGVAGDIDVTGSSTITGVNLVDGKVTLSGNVILRSRRYDGQWHLV